MVRQRINIAVIEPSQIVFEGFSNIILRSDKHFYIYRLIDFEEFKTFSKRESIHVVVLNPVLVQNRITEFTKLKASYPEISWISIVYSFFDEEIQKAFDGIIAVTDSEDTIIRQLNKFSDPDLRQEGQTDHLTDREKDVLRLLVRGMYNKEIGKNLNISTHTVITHRKNIVEKTGIKSLSGLTVYAISKKIAAMEDIS